MEGGEEREDVTVVRVLYAKGERYRGEFRKTRECRGDRVYVGLEEWL